MPDNANNQTEPPLTSSPGRRRLALVAAGVTLGVGISYLISRLLRGGGRLDKSGRQLPENIVDDQGTTQQKAAKILRKLRDRAFESSDEKLALALGRPIEEITAWNAGSEIIDDDVVMKARGIAMHRGVHVE